MTGDPNAHLDPGSIVIDLSILGPALFPFGSRSSGRGGRRRPGSDSSLRARSTGSRFRFCLGLFRRESDPSSKFFEGRDIFPVKTQHGHRDQHPPIDRLTRPSEITHSFIRLSNCSLYFSLASFFFLSISSRVPISRAGISSPRGFEVDVDDRSRSSLVRVACSERAREEGPARGVVRWRARRVGSILTGCCCHRSLCDCSYEIICKSRLISSSSSPLDIQPHKLAREWRYHVIHPWIFTSGTSTLCRHRSSDVN